MPDFPAEGLVRVPTARALPEGRYLAAFSGRYEKTGEWRPVEAGVTIDAGLLAGLQAGIAFSTVRDGAFPALTWAGKGHLLREAGGIPGLAVGVVSREGAEVERDVYIVASKELNLPSAGFFRVHAGGRWEAVRQGGRGRVRALGAMEKTWFLWNHRLRAMVEWDGDRLHAGVERRLASGVRASVAVGPFDSEPGASRPAVLFALGFGNEETLAEIEAAKRLARQAARIAAERE
jgi:hypothetical protein